MADVHPPQQSPGFPHPPPPQQARDRSGSMSLGTESENGVAPANGNGAVHNQPAGQGPPSKPDVSKQVQDVLTSEIAVAAMLHRLKQSIAAAKEFAMFLKKRSILEEEHAHGLRKLCRMTQENLRRPEHKQGTFAQAYDEMLHIHDRMAENGGQFAISLAQMHEDLLELAAIAERNRKGWKTNGLAAEQRVAEIEAAMRKSKAKYDSLADEYERARTGDTSGSSRAGGKMFGFKGPKSAQQHEEDLFRKVQGADTDYHGRVQALQGEKQELVNRTRPEAVKALQELVKETDSGVSLQMQKFASFNEKLLLSNGISISPLKNPADASQGPRSLREAVASIDNERDLNEYLASHHSKVPPNQGEIKYERNPVLNPQPNPLGFNQQGASQPSGPLGLMGPGQTSPPGQFPVQPPYGQQQQQQHGLPGSLGGSSFGSPIGSPGQPPQMTQSFGSSMGGGGGAQGPRPESRGQQQQQQQQQHSRNFSTGTMLSRSSAGQQTMQSNNARHSGGGPATRYSGPVGGQSQGGGPPQLGALPFQQPQPPQQQQQHQPPPGPPPGQGQQGQYPSAPPPSQQQQQQQQQYQTPAFQPPTLQAQPHPRDSGGYNPLMANPTSQQGGVGGSAMQPGPSPLGTQQHSPPTPQQQQTGSAGLPVFGVALDKLYERDGLAVPMVVYQCIQAVDLFGLNVEGIYRQSGSVNSINKLKAMFDKDATSATLDFRNPENFFHDVNSVTGLLKQFFRDLPDPLLTREHHQGFIEAAKTEDDTMRRDSLHAIINMLPDPNYATLRHLTLHLHRVMDNAHVTRMNSHNLAVIFGPTLMGTDNNTSTIADAGWQIKAIDTILQNTYQIFDDD